MIHPKYGSIPILVDALTKKLEVRDARLLKAKQAALKSAKPTDKSK